MKINISPSNDDKIQYKIHVDNKNVVRKFKNIDKIEAQSNSSQVCTANLILKT